MEAQEPPNSMYPLDMSTFGSPAHLERRSKVMSMLTEQPAQGGLAMSLKEVRELYSSAFFAACKALFARRVQPRCVSNEFLFLLVWNDIFVRVEQPFPWRDELASSFQEDNDSSPRSEDYATYYRHQSEILRAGRLEHEVAGPTRDLNALRLRPLPPPGKVETQTKAETLKTTSQPTPVSATPAVLPPVAAPAVSVPAKVPAKVPAVDTDPAAPTSRSKGKALDKNKPTPAPARAPAASSPVVQPSGLSQSTWATVSAGAKRGGKSRAPVVTDAPPAVTSLPGMVMHARNQAIHAARMQRADEQIQESQRQAAALRADEGLRGYTPPAYQMSESERSAVWRRVFGRTRLPDPPHGTFELPLESKEWCFERCFGPNGQILARTLESAISDNCTIWFAPGPDGRPFTKLVVGLKVKGYVTSGLCDAIVETWLNIRLWCTSDSTKVMSNGVQAIRRQHGSQAVILRAFEMLQKCKVPKAQPTPAPVSATGAKPPQQQAAPRQPIVKVAKTAAVFRTRAEEEAHLAKEIRGRMGTNQCPANVAQALTAWFRDIRASNHLTRKEIAALAVGVWSTAAISSSRATEHLEACRLWFEDRGFE